MSAIYVYPELEITFIHLPKCAGKTIQKLLSHTSKDCEQYHAHLPDKYSDFWKFAVCRNPFDRFISAWRYCIKRGWVSDMSPPQFLDHVRDIDRSKLFSVSIQNHRDVRENPSYMCLHHASPMSHPDRLITDDVKLYRFERLGAMIDEFKKFYGIKCGLIHENQTQHDPFQCYYDSVLYHKVLDYYTEDFDRFTYPRSLPLT